MAHRIPFFAWWSSVLLACALGVAGCDGEDPIDDRDAGEPEDLSARKREVLAAIGENVIAPTVRTFDDAAAALEAATAAFAADPSDANRMAARDAWVDAIDAWQRAEMMQIGPAGKTGTNGAVAGAMGLGDEIYSWPTTSTCRIDQETVEDAHADPDTFAAELVNVRGLDAMEYLLFASSLENTCSDLSPINAEGSWAALGDAQIQGRRAVYAHTLAVLVRRHAATLREAWSPDGGDFVGELRTAGDGSALFATVQRALNDLAGAMLYVDTDVRDMKLGEPAGITCTGDACIEALESRWAMRSKENILANLRAYQELVLGGPPGTDALGIDDLLVDVGAEALATQLAEAIEAAIAAVEAIEGSLREAIESGDPAVMAAYDALGPAQRLFKVDVVTVLDIEPTTMRVGDDD